MRHKVLSLIAFILFVGSIIYIYGQAGLMDCNQISLKQYAIHNAIALVVFVGDTFLINYLGKEGGNQ